MSDKPTVTEALSAVMEEVQAIRKGDRNTQQNFNFRGIDSVVNAVGPALRKHGVIVVPTGVTWESERYQTKNGAQMRGITTTISFRFYGPAGDFIDAQACGEASDAGDKAMPKAHSVTYRTLLLQALCIPTDEVDPDAESHERHPVVAAAAPSPSVVPAFTAENVVVGFGKNKGKRLGDLAPKQLEWYANVWEPNPQFESDEDRALKTAAQQLVAA